MNLALILNEKKCGCSSCEKNGLQPISNFWRNKNHTGGYSNYCKDCTRISSKKWADQNRDKVNAKAKRLREKWKEEDPQKVWRLKRNTVLKRHYGITLEQYNQMFIEQNGCCAICERPASDFPKKLVVDHDHFTLKVRKLLCGLCNQMLGSSKENLETLQKAIEYLQVHNED